jgi:GTP cyclohydrolase I
MTLEALAGGAEPEARTPAAPGRRPEAGPPVPAVDAAPLEDVQGRADPRGIAIEQVGVTGLRYPITVLDRAQVRQPTVARITLSVDLPHHFKGTHMSRFLEVLEGHRGEVTLRTIPEILAELRRRLEAERARIEVEFPYFLERTAPITGARALMDYACSFVGEASGASSDFVLGIEVPVSSLCPCSKEISRHGAHNQRGHIRMQVRSVPDAAGAPALIWLEELIEVAEACASTPVYPLLKRPDQRHLTMQAYDNPVFVEDMVRNVARRLMDDPRVAGFRVRVENHESIHNHDAFAQVSWGRVVGQPSAAAWT